jgi:hypothetical protein
LRAPRRRRARTTHHFVVSDQPHDEDVAARLGLPQRVAVAVVLRKAGKKEKKKEKEQRSSENGNSARHAARKKQPHDGMRPHHQVKHAVHVNAHGLAARGRCRRRRR